MWHLKQCLWSCRTHHATGQGLESAVQARAGGAPRDSAEARRARQDLSRRPKSAASRRSSSAGWSSGSAPAAQRASAAAADATAP